MVRREAVQGRIVQYAWYHVYDKYTQKLYNSKDFVCKCVKRSYQYFIPEKYVMIEAPAITERSIRCEQLNKEILVVDDDCPVVLQSNYNKPRQRKNSQPTAKTLPWVMIERQASSAPTNSYSFMENYELISHQDAQSSESSEDDLA